MMTANVRSFPDGQADSDNVANNAQRRLRILIVDDDPDNVRAITAMAVRMGHDATNATTGHDALALLGAQAQKIDVVFLGRVSPYADAAALLPYIQRDPVLRMLPVILQSAGNDAPPPMGVLYSITPPYDPHKLQGVLSAALRQAERQKRLAGRIAGIQGGLDMLVTGTFRFRTLAEAELLAVFIARCFPDPDMVVTGLSELMINAIEHGNLEIGADEKEELVKAGSWRQEIERRLADPLYADRFAQLAVARRDGGVYIVISDQGKGFAWQQYIRIDPARAARASGRGIAHAAQVCFDMLRYNENGTKVVGFIQDRQPLEW